MKEAANPGINLSTISNARTPEEQKKANREIARGLKLLTSRVVAGLQADGSLNRDVKPDWGTTPSSDNIRREIGCIARAFAATYQELIKEQLQDWELVDKSSALDATPSLIAITHNKARLVCVRRNTTPNPDETTVEIYTITDDVVDAGASVTASWEELHASASFSGRMAVSEDSKYGAFFHYAGGSASLIVIDLATGEKLGDVSTTISQATNAAQPVWVGNYIYWPEFSSGDIIIFNVTNRQNPSEAATFSTSLTTIKDLVVEGNNMYGVGSGGVVGIDRSSPASLVEDDTASVSGAYNSFDLYDGVLVMFVRSDASNVRWATVDVNGTTVTPNSEDTLSLSTSVMDGYSVIFHRGYAICWSEFDPSGTADVLDAHLFDVTDPTAVTFVETLAYTHASTGALAVAITREGRRGIASFNFGDETQIARPGQFTIVSQACKVSQEFGGTGADLSKTGPGVATQEVYGGPLVVVSYQELVELVATIVLVNQGSLTAKDTSTVDGTYGAEEQAVIDNNRTRIEEIEAALVANDILT